MIKAIVPLSLPYLLAIPILDVRECPWIIHSLELKYIELEVVSNNAGAISVSTDVDASVCGLEMLCQHRNNMLEMLWQHRNNLLALRIGEMGLGDINGRRGNLHALRIASAGSEACAAGAEVVVATRVGMAPIEILKSRRHGWKFRSVRIGVARTKPR
uniref:Uncharacterized protein n=1 Tax=Cannabis sativa TaxID=3483 RepID=A0A803PCZ8_CANSA